MSDTSAETLLRLVSAGHGSDAPGWMVEPMKSDPPLALWAVCAAWQRTKLRPGSIAQLAQWLCEHVLDVLQWPPEERFGSGLAGVTEAELAANLVTGFQLAELAATLSAGAGCVEAEGAFLYGLLASAEQWLKIGTGSHRAPRGMLPDWLVEHSSATQAVVQEAGAIFSGQSPPPADVNVEEIVHRAEEQRVRWFARGSALIELLPEICGRMARLARLERDFRAAVETEKLEAMAEFAAGAGHEINNPLAIIGGRAQLLMADEVDPERRRELAVINAQVKRAHEMIADVRLFARPPQPEKTASDLAQLVDELVAEVASQGAERGVRVSRTGEPGPAEIEADPTQLAVALRAVCRNALEWIGHDGRIEIALAVGQRQVEIRISDDGPGMTPEQRRHAFDPFYSARQAGRGLGLGLSKCWRIVTSHGGRVEAENGPERGAVFTIILPRWQSG